MFNKIWKSVYFESKFQGKFKRAVQWMVPGGYSYMSPVYRNLYPSSRTARRIDFDVFSSQDCLPFQLPDDNSVQGAFCLDPDRVQAHLHGPFDVSEISGPVEATCAPTLLGKYLQRPHRPR